MLVDSHCHLDFPELAGDIAGYEVAARPPLAGQLLGVTVLTTPPPSRGGAIVLEILETLAALDEPALDDVARAVASAYERSWQGVLTGTTHISVVDGADNADD